MLLVILAKNVLRYGQFLIEHGQTGSLKRKKEVYKL